MTQYEFLEGIKNFADKGFLIAWFKSQWPILLCFLLLFLAGLYLGLDIASDDCNRYIQNITESISPMCRLT